MLAELFNKAACEETPVSLISMRCLRHRNRTSSCSRCVASCPEGAIRIDGTIRVDAEKCTGCLACVADCPTEALNPAAAAHAFRARLTSGEKSPLRIACSENYFVHPDVSTPCLGGLSIHDLAVFFLLAPGGVEFHVNACRDCPKGNSLPCWEQRIRTLAEKVPAVKKRLLVVTEVHRDGIHAGRRAFFNLFGRASLQSARLLLGAEPGGAPEAEAGKHLPARIRFFQQAIQKLPPEKALEWTTPLMPMLRFAASCNHCGRCVGACPAGAIKIHRDNNAARITHDRARCCGCGLCQHVCPATAIMPMA